MASVALLVMLIGGVAVFVVVQDLPPGTTLAGEPVSAPDEAARVADQVAARLAGLPVVLTTEAGTTEITAGELGATLDVANAVRAVDGNTGAGAWLRRLTGGAAVVLPVGLLFTTGQAEVVAERLSSPPVDGDIAITASGLRVTDAVVGVDVTASMVSRAFRDAAAALEDLPVDDWPVTLEVEVAAEGVPPTITQTSVDAAVERIETMTATPIEVTAEVVPEDAQTFDGQGVPVREVISVELGGAELLQLLAVQPRPDSIERDRLAVVAAGDAAAPPALTSFLERADVVPVIRVNVADRSPTPTKVADPDPETLGSGGAADLPVYADAGSVTGRLEAEVVAPGLAPDADATVEAIVAAMLDGDTTVEVRGEPVEEFDLAEDFGIIQPVSTFTTFYEPGQSRVTNIHRIAEIMDGTLVPPGGNLDVNHAVGRRTAADGFVSAGAILEGEFITDVGGGVSQFATTFFNAMWFSGIDIITHTPHSFYFERYPAGREATIDYPGVNLELNNNTPHWILIDTAVTDDSVTVTFWSTEWFDVGTTMGPRETTAEGFRMRIMRTATAPDGAVDDDQFTIDYKLP